MEFYDRALTCIKLGAPLVKIASLSIRERISRLKSVVRNEDLSGLERFEADMRGALEDLERSYRTKEML
jgi:V/A-type H+-transporting ATPase subunit A